MPLPPITPLPLRPMAAPLPLSPPLVVTAANLPTSSSVHPSASAAAVLIAAEP